MRPVRKALLPVHLLAIIGLLIIDDLASKAIVRANMAPGDSISLIDDVLRITYVQNFSGFSWWVPTLPGWAKPVFQFVLFSIVLAAFPVYVFYTHTRRNSIWADIAFVGVVASCASHLLDGLFIPFTTDFIQVFRSPCANFADIYSYVAIGAIAVETILVFRINKPKWKGVRHLLNARARVWKEFVDYFRRGLRP